MTPEFVEYLDKLDRFARGESAAEDAYRREIAEKMAALERQRAFAFRRLNLVRTIAESVAAAPDEERAAALGNAACMREIGWTGASEPQREVMARFAPVAVAIWRVAVAASADPASAGEQEKEAAKPAEIDAAFADFEAWYAANRKGTFWNLMDQEPLNLPLVEVS